MGKLLQFLSCFLTLPLLTLPITNAAVLSTPNISSCPPACYCETIAAGTSVNCCSQVKDPTVPYLPNDTVKLDLSDCFIEEIPPYAFSNLGNLKELKLSNGQFNNISSKSFIGLENLHTLILNYGRLRKLEKGSFSSLTSLKILHLDYNPLRIRHLPVILAGLNRSKTIREISLHATNREMTPELPYTMNDTTLKYEYVTGLEGLELDSLDLSLTAIHHIDSEVIPLLTNIQCLDLSQNFLDYGSYKYFFRTWEPMNNSRTIVITLYEESVGESIRPDFKEQCKAALADKALSSCTRLTPDEMIKLQKEYPHYKVLSFGHWRRVNLMYALPYGDFGETIFLPNNVTHLYLDGEIAGSLGRPIFGLTCLRHLSISRSPIKIQAGDGFKHMPSLEFLNLSRCVIGSQMNTKSRSLIQNLMLVKTIDLSFNNIYEITLSHIPLHAPKLEALYLQNNSLARIPDVKSKSLKLLDLSSNKISTLTESDTRILEDLNRDTEGNTSIYLEGNSFLCFCNAQTYYFLHWIQTSSIHIVNKNTLSCVNKVEGGSIQTKLLDISLTTYKLRCNEDFILVASASIAACIIVIVVVSYTVHRKRWQLAIWVNDLKYKYMYRSRRQREIDEESSETECRYVYILGPFGAPGCNEIDQESSCNCEAGPNCNIREDEHTFAYIHLPKRLKEFPDFEIRPIVHLSPNALYRYSDRDCHIAVPEGVHLQKSINACHSFLLVFSPALLREKDARRKAYIVEAIKKATDRFRGENYGETNLIVVIHELPSFKSCKFTHSDLKKVVPMLSCEHQVIWPAGDEEGQGRAFQQVVEWIARGNAPVEPRPPLPEPTPETPRRPWPCPPDLDGEPAVEDRALLRADF